MHVEGQTEEEFVGSVLAQHLYDVGFTNVSARIVGSARSRKRRGGICGWPTVRTEIANHLNEDPGAFATTFVDYYALPGEGENAWPGRNSCAGMTIQNKAAHIHNALQLDFERHHGQELCRRFLPFVAMHEFEGLLFSDPVAMASGMGYEGLAEDFAQIRASFESPEHINDSPQTAPSKRIMALIKNYDKVMHGNVAALSVTLPRIREQCPVFGQWLTALELVPPPRELLPR